MWLKHFCFLVLLWQVFGNDDPIILGNSCTVSQFFDLVRVALWESNFPLYLSVPSVCAMFRSSEESKISSEFKTIFVFLLFNVME